MENSQYSSCNVKGSGRIISNGSKYNFKIIDLCADGAKISSLNDIEMYTQVEMVIILPAFLFHVRINSIARIVQKKKYDNGFEYDVEFIGLSERDKSGIDEIMRSTCSSDL